MLTIRPIGHIASIILLTSNLIACATQPPKHPDNICSVFNEKKSWYKQAKHSEKKWQTPVAVTMAIIYQESSFKAKVKPPRKKILWLFPGPRPSSAYGYAQVLDDTWKWYQHKTDNYGADRDDFADVVDFIGWYNSLSNNSNGIDFNDAYNLYLAYHEGHGGFKRKTYYNKPWLKRVANKVNARASRYQQQLAGCEYKLQHRGWLHWLF